MSSANIVDSNVEHFKKNQTRYWAFLPAELPELFAGETLTLSETCWPTKFHHWTRVSRAKVGETVTLVDATKQRTLLGRFTAFSKTHGELYIEKIDTLSVAPTTTIACVPFIKADRWEWLLEKLTELGVSEIVPIETRYAQHTDLDSPKARTRWERIIVSAAEQSEQWQIPKVHASIKLAHLPEYLLTYETRPQCIVPCERLAISTEKGTSNPPLANGPIAFAVGPEGGWHQDELDGLIQAGFLPYRLGPHVLRVETAAIAMASLIHERRP